MSGPESPTERLVVRALSHAAYDARSLAAEVGQPLAYVRGALERLSRRGAVGFDGDRARLVGGLGRIRERCADRARPGAVGKVRALRGGAVKVKSCARS